MSTKCLNDGYFACTIGCTSAFSGDAGAWAVWMNPTCSGAPQHVEGSSGACDTPTPSID